MWPVTSDHQNITQDTVLGIPHVTAGYYQLAPMGDLPECKTSDLALELDSCRTPLLDLEEQSKPSSSSNATVILEIDEETTTKKLEENDQAYSVEDTVEVDFGVENDIDSGFASETVELDIGTNEENAEGEINSDYVVAANEKNKQDQVQEGIKSSENEDSSAKSPSSQVCFNSNINCKAIQLLEACKTDDSLEPSIPAFVLYRVSELHESTREKIEVEQVEVGPYKIRSDLAPILRHVLDKHGDIFRDCEVKPDTFLVTVCEAVQYLQQIPFKRLLKNHIEFVRESLSLPEAFGVDVEWLNNHCDYLENTIHQMLRYLALKRERDQIITNVESKKQLSHIEDHLKRLEGSMKSLKSLWRRISGKSVTEGLF